MPATRLCQVRLAFQARFAGQARSYGGFVERCFLRTGHASESALPDPPRRWLGSRSRIAATSESKSGAAGRRSLFHQV